MELKDINIHFTLARVDLTDDVLRNYFYDWFCKDESLPNKARKLLGKLKQITPSSRFSPHDTYTFFKNNCPGNGSLYDDFRICDMKTQDVLFCVVPSSGHNITRGEAEVWGKAPNGEFKQLVQGSWADAKAFFKLTDEQFAARQAKVAPSPFVPGAEVHLIGEYVKYGELPEKHVVGEVSDEHGGFTLVGGYQQFRRDGTHVNPTRKRSMRNRTYRCELWSTYVANQQAEDERIRDRNAADKLAREISTQVHMLQYQNGGPAKALECLTKLQTFITEIKGSI